MKLFSDKQVRHLGVFLLFSSLLIFLSGMGLDAIRVKSVQHLFLSHDQALATSLLEQGVAPEVIAQALTRKTSSPEGTALLAAIGLSEQTAIRFLPWVDEYQRGSRYAVLLNATILSLFIYGGVLLFLSRRDGLYQQATKVITRYTEGDFSCRLPQMSEGALYRLFASVDQLATNLQSKNDAEHKAKVFLKHTLSDISHQLKTPLTALTLYHDIIADEPDNRDTVTEYTNKTGLALKRMDHLIASLLKITRLDAGNVVFEKERCPVSALIEQAIHELTTRAANEGKEIRIAALPEEAILCDRQWTSEAIGNIVKNTLDYTESGGTVDISWKRTPAMLRICIADNGAGIAPEDVHHIFKRFYRSQHSLDTQGVGLGLSLTKSIIEGQGGIVSVQSTLHEGTAFTMSFLTEM